MYRILYEETQAEIVEKKSRFIAYLKPVHSEEEAASFIEGIKKKHWDARHNCSAIVIGCNNEFTRCSDDGEPAGTAGKPMLDVLLNEQVHDMAVVVTRYFGGVLLGTGGLVRAYQGAVKAALEQAKILEKYAGYLLVIRTDYNGLGKIQYLAAKQGAFILDTRYSEDVIMRIVAKSEDTDGFLKKIQEATGGQASVGKSEELFFGLLDGEVIM